MVKEHEYWVKQKIKIDELKNRVLFNEREIWWCSLGINVGHEQDGRGDKYQRPVLIIKCINMHTCWILPLTLSTKETKERLHIMFSSKTSQVVLTQIRIIDQRRLLKKIATLSEFQYEQIKKTMCESLCYTPGSTYGF